MASQTVINSSELPTTKTMHDQPSVSVIVPVYNLSDHLRETLDSILTQEYRGQLEILIIDDGSTDNTVAIAEQAKASDDRIKILRNDHRKGVAGARNTGIERAQGDWIAFIDGDDVWEAAALQKKMDAAAKHPNTDLISSDFFDWFYESEQKLVTPEKVSHPIDLTKHGDGSNPYAIRIHDPVNSLLEYPYLTWTSVVIAKKALLQKVGGFKESLEMWEDRDLWLRLASQCSCFTYVNEPLCLYRKRTGSLTRRGIPGKVWAVQALEELLQQPDFQPYVTKMKRLLAQYYLDVSYYYRKTNNFKLAAGSAYKGLRIKKNDLKLFKSLVAASIGK